MTSDTPIDPATVEKAAGLLVQAQTQGTCTFGKVCDLCDCFAHQDGGHHRDGYARAHMRHVLAGVLPDVIRQAKAEAWDEGWLARECFGRYGDLVANPYRAQAIEEGDGLTAQCRCATDSLESEIDSDPRGRLATFTEQQVEAAARAHYLAEWVGTFGESVIRQMWETDSNRSTYLANMRDALSAAFGGVEIEWRLRFDDESSISLHNEAEGRRYGEDFPGSHLEYRLITGWSPVDE